MSGSSFTRVEDCHNRRRSFPADCAAILMDVCRSPFREIWAVDFEFNAQPGENPEPVCLVAWELLSGKRIRLWQDDLLALDRPPYSTDTGALMVAYYASAEVGCHLALGWPAPERVLDVFCEFRCLTNGLRLSCGDGLIGALIFYGLDAIGAAEKDTMRDLVLRGGPWTDAESSSILDYCENDVESLVKLLTRMAPAIDLNRGLLRASSMVATAKMERTGVPIDRHTLNLLRSHWTVIKDQLIAEIDGDYGVFDGHTFKEARFAEYLSREGIPWPLLPSGRPNLQENVFREMARSYPAVTNLHELRVSLSKMKLEDLAVGRDGRNRCLLSAFRSKTARFQPSSKRFIFGPAVWLRSLIKPEPGQAVAYIDWEQQEFGIGGALAGDPMMQVAYLSGDPYLEFAKQAGAVPRDATKTSHAHQREQFKACALAVQYGMGAESLAQRVGQSVAAARELLRLHHQVFRRFWEWSDRCVDYAFLWGEIHTSYGWRLRLTDDPNPRSIRNFPMQANGAEMLRIACCLGTQQSIEICAPIHDAVLIAAPIDEIEKDVERMKAAMAEASRAVLGGFELRTEAKIVRYPDRYSDPRGTEMWDRVMTLLDELVANEPVPPPQEGGAPAQHLCAPDTHTLGLVSVSNTSSEK